MTSCPRRSASRSTDSGTSFAPASTIVIEDPEPATVRSRSLSWSWLYVGFTTISPSMYPSRVPLTGPEKGISEIVSAADVPMMLRMSGMFSWSADSASTTTCVSFRYPFGKSGRIVRSVNRLARIASCPGRPSRRKKLPGIFPIA